MKKVSRTKKFSISQIKRMVDNLRDKFNLAAKIEVGYWRFTSDNKELYYSLYISDFDTTKEFPTWKALQDKYFSLMED